MKRTLLNLTILLTMSLVSVSLIAQDLYLIIGQSNASGRDDNFDHNGQDLKTNDVKLLSAGGKFWKAKQPLNRHSNVKKTNKVQGVNFGMEFGKEMHADNGRTVYLVSNARGGTRVPQWKKSNSSGYFYDTIERVHRAESQCNCTLTGILWHQGEANTRSTSLGYTSSYLSSLEDVINDFRTEFSDVPFIVGQLYDKTSNAPFNEMIKTVTNSSFDEDDVDWVSSDNLTAFDNTHFDAASIRELGRRYANVMQQYVGGSFKRNGNDDLTNSESFIVFPNPANETIQISGVNENETFMIYNLSGVKVFEARGNVINVSKLETGIYVIVTQGGDKIKFHKN